MDAVFVFCNTLVTTQVSALLKRYPRKALHGASHTKMVKINWPCNPDSTLVYLLEVPPLIEVPLGKIADFKRVKMVNTA